MTKMLNKTPNAIVWIKSINVRIMSQSTHPLAPANRSGDAFVFESSCVERADSLAHL